LEFEQKLLLQKDWKNWTFAYNLVFETEIEGVFRDNEGGVATGGDVTTDEEEDEGIEVEGIIGHALGASYAVGKGDFRLGAEMVIESEFSNWNHYEDTSVYAGPVVSYQGGKNWWLSVTPMYQLSSVESEPDFNVRMIAGIEF
jgi:hypothetical protein